MTSSVDRETKPEMPGSAAQLRILCGVAAAMQRREVYKVPAHEGRAYDALVAKGFLSDGFPTEKAGKVYAYLATHRPYVPRAARF
jgi:hypothetical protein